MQLVDVLIACSGLLLKPDKPARTLDVSWLSKVFNATGTHSAPQARALWSTSTSLEVEVRGAGAHLGGHPHPGCGRALI